jgi:tetratricopeptide (TPR) repeat protein
MALSGCGTTKSNCEKWIEEAQTAESKGDYAKAELLLQAAVGAAESSPVPQLQKVVPYSELASCYRQQHKLKDEERILRQELFELKSPTLAGKLSRKELLDLSNLPSIQLAMNQRVQGNLAEARDLLKSVQTNTFANRTGEQSGEYALSNIELSQVLIMMGQYDEASKVIKQIPDVISEFETKFAKAGISDDKSRSIVAQQKEMYMPIYQVQQSIVDWKLGYHPNVPNIDIDFEKPNKEYWSPELMTMWGDFLAQNRQGPRAVKAFRQVVASCDKRLGPDNEYSKAARTKAEAITLANGRMADLFKGYF